MDQEYQDKILDTRHLLNDCAVDGEWLLKKISFNNEMFSMPFPSHSCEKKYLSGAVNGIIRLYGF